MDFNTLWVLSPFVFVGLVAVCAFADGAFQ